MKETILFITLLIYTRFASIYLSLFFLMSNLFVYQSINIELLIKAYLIINFELPDKHDFRSDWRVYPTWQAHWLDSPSTIQICWHPSLSVMHGSIINIKLRTCIFISFPCRILQYQAFSSEFSFTNHYEVRLIFIEYTIALFKSS